MIWWSFATNLERADTSEVTDLHSGAPLLYSTVLAERAAHGLLIFFADLAQESREPPCDARPQQPATAHVAGIVGSSVNPADAGQDD